MNKWTPPRNSGEIPQVSTRFSLSMEMSRLTRDGTAEPVSRNKILRHENADREILIFAVQLTTCRTGNLTRSINTLAICVTIHAYICAKSKIPAKTSTTINTTTAQCMFFIRVDRYLLPSGTAR